MVKDPVCGMEIDEKRPAAKYNFEGKMYYFCSDTCKKKFSRSPDDFVE